MFALDSLIFDLIYGAGAQLTPESLIDALGGEEEAQKRMVVDPDLDAPFYEMQVSPSAPLRKRGERRLLIVDENVAPLRNDPQRDPIVPRDLRPDAERLITLVEKTGARLGRMNAFGTPGDAVIVTRSARDLRGLALLTWLLDPTLDIDGRRRASQLGEAEVREKVHAYELRLEELDEQAILDLVPPVRAERRGDLIVVNALSDRDGSWDIRKSLELELRLCALDRFARIPGAKQSLVTPDDPPEPAPAPEPEPEPAATSGPAITAREVGGRVVLVFPADRFSLDIAAALGKRDLSFLAPSDQVPGPLKDRAYEHGCDFIAPLEFLSEVFLDGKPVSKAQFDAGAQEIAPGVRALEAHLPRFGPVRVVDRVGTREITSLPLAALS